MNKTKPKYIKFVYRAKERLWLKVVKIDGNWIHGTVASKPLTVGIKYGDAMKININKVIEAQY